MSDVNFHIEIEGATAYLESMKKLRDNAPRAFANAVFMWVQDVLTTAQGICPVDTGWLRKSAYCMEPNVNGTDFDLVLGFSATYALFVHEIFKHYVVGEWKFLQKAIDYRMPDFVNVVTRMTAGFIGSGANVQALMARFPTTPPLDEVNRAALEGMLSARRSKQRGNEKIQSARALGRTNNQARIQRESAASLRAQREGRRGPRPGSR